MSEKSDEEYIYGVESMHMKEKVPRGEKVYPSPVDGSDGSTMEETAMEREIKNTREING